jgi:hypothetical protein
VYGKDLYVENTSGSTGGVMRADGYMDFLHLWSSTNTGVRIGNDVAGTLVQFNPNGTVGIGTTNPAHLLHVAGAIGAEEIIVSSTGADYVFRPDYRLASLSEIASYVKEHHHLPDVPSEAEVRKKGVNLGEMQSKLLAKIEELTLHMIRADQENQELRERILRLEADRRVAAPTPKGQEEAAQ